jgi:hypothetical protein
MKANNNEEMEITLWEYIDGLSSESEKQKIETLIASNAEWQAKYKALLSLHTTIDLAELEQPSMRFTRNVMEEIGKLHIAPATREYINRRVIWSIVGFFITAILAYVIYGLSQVDWSAGSSTNLIPIDLSKVDYSPMLSNTYMNVFMMVNVIVGLLLLDRFLGQKIKRERDTAY